MVRPSDQLGMASKPQPTPLPLYRIGLLGLILLANNSSIWMIFSFLPFMVADFYPQLSTTQLGFRAGILGAAFSAGGLLGNLLSGVLSDKFGRRPALMCGLFGTALSSMAFGFSPNFPFAVASRFMWGLLNGNIGVAKTYLAEISDDTNTAKGMALFGVIGGTGRIIGPIIGGFLSTPAAHYPVFRGTIFETFPFALPSIMISINCFIVLVICYFVLEETLPDWKRNPVKKSKQQVISFSSGYSPLNTSEDNNERVDAEIELSAVVRTGELSYEQSPNVDAVDTSLQDDNTSGRGFEEEKGSPSLSSLRKKKVGDSGKHKVLPRRVSFSSKVMVKELDGTVLEFKDLKQVESSEVPIASNAKITSTNYGVEQLVEQYSNGSEYYLSLGMNQVSFFTTLSYLLRQRGIVISTMLYGLNAFANSVATEIFPLWVVTSPSHGGFNYDAKDIGTVSMVGGALSIVLQLTLYPYLVSIIGVLRVQRLGTILFALNIIIMPTISLVNGFHSSGLEWAVILIGQVFQFAFVTWCLISLFVLISNSCYSHQRATVNGIGQTCASFGRMLGPYVAGNMFAWSENNGMSWPFNFYFTFYFVGVVLFFNYTLSCFLPRSIVRRKREPKVPQDYFLQEQLKTVEDVDNGEKTRNTYRMQKDISSSRSNLEFAVGGNDDIQTKRSYFNPSTSRLNRRDGYGHLPSSDDADIESGESPAPIVAR